GAPAAASPRSHVPLGGDEDAARARRPRAPATPGEGPAAVTPPDDGPGPPAVPEPGVGRPQEAGTGGRAARRGWRKAVRGGFLAVALGVGAWAVASRWDEGAAGLRGLAPAMGAASPGAAVGEIGRASC